jgi:hypothetical protein
MEYTKRFGDEKSLNKVDTTAHTSAIMNPESEGYFGNNTSMNYDASFTRIDARNASPLRENRSRSRSGSNPHTFRLRPQSANPVSSNLVSRPNNTSTTYLEPQRRYKEEDRYERFLQKTEASIERERAQRKLDSQTIDHRYQPYSYTRPDDPTQRLSYAKPLRGSPSRDSIPKRGPDFARLNLGDDSYRRMKQDKSADLVYGHDA